MGSFMCAGSQGQDLMILPPVGRYFGAKTEPRLLCSLIGIFFTAEGRTADKRRFRPPSEPRKRGVIIFLAAVVRSFAVGNTANDSFFPVGDG